MKDMEQETWITRDLLCIVHTHVFGPNFPEKNVAFQFFHSMFYLYIKPMIIFQGIILYMDIIIAF